MSRNVFTHSSSPADLHNYLLVTLERANLADPWGLMLSIAPGGFWINASQCQFIQCYWSVLSNMNPQVFGRSRNVTELVRHLSSLVSRREKLPLLPGDFILSINGYTASTLETLSDASNLFRSNYRVHLILLRSRGSIVVPNSSAGCLKLNWRKTSETALPSPAPLQNTLCRNEFETNPGDGCRSHLFLNNEIQEDFQVWLTTRKSQWRKRYQVVPMESPNDQSDCNVAVQFWAEKHDSFHSWLDCSKKVWTSQYSWNQRKRQQIQDCEQVVYLANNNFLDWLQNRKMQWKVLRRKRQKLLIAAPMAPARIGSQKSPTSVTNMNRDCLEQLFIDDLLEKRETSLRKQPPLDIRFLFEESLGCPDDVVAHCLSFLSPLEHANLLALNQHLRSELQHRNLVWRLLCPQHWTVPRRPRRPWCAIYLALLRTETEATRKRLDDLLAQSSTILLKGDQLQTIEKMVIEAEHCLAFDVNYSSGVVCERNSLLNLAVIHQRQKVVRWLVESKNANIETSDRGGFTPLLNAAWAGNKQLVRFLMQKGANRFQTGTCHYTRPLASPEFTGLTAAGWATKRGHHDIATLINRGL